MILSWLSQLNKKQRRVYIACYGGIAFDAMDSTMFPLAIPSLIAILGITHPQAGALTSAGLIGAAIGGWSAGILADRIGRVRVLQFTLLWVSVFTLLSAFVTNYHELLAVRLLQGLGVGGEGAAAGVLISEVVAPQLRGRIAASVQSAYAVGYGTSVAIMPLIYWLFAPHIAWRVFFAVGLLPALFIIYIRKNVRESEVYEYDRQRRNTAQSGGSFLEIFQKRYLLSTITGTCMSFGILGGAYVMITWLPTYLRMSLHLPVAYTSAFLAINILGSFTGPLLCGTIIDTIGRRKTIMVLLACQAINVAVYTLTPIRPVATLFLGYFLGALQAAIASTLMPTFSELFPTRIRANGAGFCTSVGRGFGSVIPALVGVGSLHMKLATAMGICALSAYAIGILSAFFLREASGVDLRNESITPVGEGHTAREIDTTYATPSHRRRL